MRAAETGRRLYRAGWRAAAFSGRQHQSLGRLVPPAGHDRFREPRLGAPFRLALSRASEIEPYFARAQALVEAGPWVYDKARPGGVRQRPAAAAGPGRRLYELVPILQDPRRHAADPFRRPLSERSEARAAASRPCSTPMSPASGFRRMPARSIISTSRRLSGNRLTVKPRYHRAGGGRDRECAAAAGVQRCDGGGRRQPATIWWAASSPTIPFPAMSPPWCCSTAGWRLSIPTS